MNQRKDPGSDFVVKKACNDLNSSGSILPVQNIPILVVSKVVSRTRIHGSGGGRIRVSK